MALIDWQDEMNTMLTAFNRQVMHSLKNIKISFKQHSLTFNPEFRKYFLEASNKRIEESFDQFQMDLKMENQLNSSVSGVTSQSPLMTLKPTTNQISSALKMNDSVKLTVSNNEISYESDNPDLNSNKEIQPSIRSINISDSDDEQDILVKVDTENIENNHQNVVSKTISLRPRTINRPNKKILDPKTLPLKIADGFKCQICEYKSGLKHRVINHIRKHTGEKPYQCKYCLLKFRYHSGLHRHVKIHHKNK